jgi:aspartate aminotransferase
LNLIRPGIDSLEDSPIVEVWRTGYGNPDIISMFGGESDIPTPAFIREAASGALADGHTFYAPNRGIPAVREALIAYNKRIYGVDLPDDRVTLTSSGMSAVMLIAQATVDPGDNVVAITPSWPNILRAMQINRAEPREVALTPGNTGWSLDLDALFAACDERTKIIYLASPGNPTGWTIERADAVRLLEFARSRGIGILSDEVYHRLVHEGPDADRGVAFSFLEIARPDDPVFVVNSFSKAWAMTGWRLGWIVYPEGHRMAFEKLIQFNTSGAPEFLQYAAIAALSSGEEFVKSFAARCRGGRDLVNARLARMPRVRNVPTSGGFYAMFEVEGVNDTLAFCKRAVLEARIGMAPGTAFGRGAERFIRLCYAISDEQLTLAMDRLESFVASYREV